MSSGAFRIEKAEDPAATAKSDEEKAQTEAAAKEAEAKVAQAQLTTAAGSRDSAVADATQNPSDVAKPVPQASPASSRAPTLPK